MNVFAGQPVYTEAVGTLSGLAQLATQLAAEIAFSWAKVSSPPTGTPLNASVQAGWPAAPATTLSLLASSTMPDGSVAPAVNRRRPVYDGPLVHPVTMLWMASFFSDGSTGTGTTPADPHV